MTRNLKALGLALVAVFAFAAITSSAAQAVPLFTGYETPSGTRVHTILEGTTESGGSFAETFITGSGKIQCHVTYEGTSLTGIDTELTVQPIAFKRPESTVGPNCISVSAGVTLTAAVSFNSCDYVFHSGVKLASDEYTGTVDVKCTFAGDAIDIKITKNGTVETKCTIKVPAQSGLSHVIYRNERKPAGETHVTAEATVNKANGKGITYTSEGGLLNCGLANGEHVEGAEYEGRVTVNGANTSRTPIDVEVSGE
jgi:hypothetical protein